MKAPKKFFFIALAGLVFLLGGVLFFQYFQLKAQAGQKLVSPLSSQSSLKPTSRPTASPTSLPPTATPTPTLTPEEPATIKRAEFKRLNETIGPCAWVPVLLYHHVLPVEEAGAILATNLNVPPEVFRSQMEYLIANGYQAISLAQMASMIKDNSLPQKPVVITFDDAYLNFYTNVYPILKEKSLKATVFVITQFVGGERYVSWSQLSEMASSGLVEVGNHTLNHPYLSGLSRQEAENQIVSASNILEERLGKKPEFLAYPYGNSSQAVKEILKEAGFKGALLTTYNSPQCLGDPYSFSRIRIGATSLSRYGL